MIGASENNLKNIDVRFPLGVMTVVSGVSGSGKSTLVKEILYKGVMRALGEPVGTPGTHRELRGDVRDIKAVEFVDQNPIGTSSRSNPATYLKAYDEIRKLFADQQLSKQMGFTPAYFSFNTEGGRCEECKGEGTITIPMQFMADIEVECEACHGKRFKQEVLDVEYRGKNIHDFLEMTVNQAIEFLGEADGTQEKKIISRLKPLQDVGLGYIKARAVVIYAVGRRESACEARLLHLAGEADRHTVHIRRADNGASLPRHIGFNEVAQRTG